MAELLIELFSEEIPARMQARAAEELSRRLAEMTGAAGLPMAGASTFHGPRRFGLRATVETTSAEELWEERGPRQGVPEAVLAAFIRGKVAGRFGGVGTEEQDAAVRSLLSGQAYLFSDEGHVRKSMQVAWKPSGKGLAVVASAIVPGRPARSILAEVLPRVMRAVAWPKSMRWGTSGFTWVRPLQRVLCVLNGAVVPFSLAAGDDDAHGLAAADVTEGHRIMAGTAPFAVTGWADYAAGLRARFVIAEAAERERIIEEGVSRLAAAEGLEVVPDRGLLAEVAGLVEWPVPLLGRIDGAFMDLPPEVMRTTMRVNQRYFALRHPDGRAAARFALVANIEASDGGAAIVAGNERVLRARLSDARFFWDLDRKRPLESFLPKLKDAVFHAKLGTQFERAERLERLARHIAPMVGADPDRAAEAARLAKADLASGMVGEFPELQGVMGGYYARGQGLAPEVADAIAEHYRPLGPGDAVPSAPVSVAVALADKLDQLAGFFAVGEKPTGSGDPYALRRAALGVIRIVRECGLRLPLRGVIEQHHATVARDIAGVPKHASDKTYVELEALQPGREITRISPTVTLPGPSALSQDIVGFLAERLRVQLRAEGLRHDLVAAAFGTSGDDDLNRLLARADALKDFLSLAEGSDLLTAYRRAANILRIEEKKDGPHAAAVSAELLREPEERALAAALESTRLAVAAALEAERFEEAMTALAALRGPVDAFFDKVTVNDPDPALRRNRLGLLASLRAAMDGVADFARIEG